MKMFPVLFPRHTKESSPQSHSLRGQQRRVRDIVLGMVGLAALLLYILACRPSWSPDGTKVVFPYYNPETKERGAALYDRTTGTVRSILAVSVRKPASVDAAKEQSWGEAMSVVAQFTRDGRHVMVTWGDERSHILLLPVGSREPARSFELPGDLDDGPMFNPYPEVGGSLFLFGKKAIIRPNMQSGATQFRQLEDEFEGALAAQGDRILYGREVIEEGPKREPNQDAKKDGQKQEEPAPEQPKQQSKTEFGEINPDDLTLKPLFTLTTEDLQAHGIKELRGFLDPEPRGSRMAMLDEDAQRIVLMNRSGIERVVEPKIAAEEYELGNLEWAPGGNKLYATVVTKRKQDENWEFNVAEVSLDTGTTRLTPVTRVSGSDIDFMLQVALSPDGGTIATSTAHLDSGVEMDDRALYMVNLRDRKRTVTKIPMPGVKKAAASAPQKTKP